MIASVAVPWHQLPAEPRWLDADLGPAGVLVGEEQPGLPVVARLFRPRPTSVAVFAANPIGQLLTVRTLVAGARVVVLTARPAPWAALRDRLPGGSKRLLVGPPNTPVPPAGTPYEPALIVDELDPGMPVPRRETGPWRTVLTLRQQLSTQIIASLRGHDLLVLQRVPEQAVEPLRAAAGISRQDARWLPEMPDGMVALVAGGQLRFARL
jgi:hypothetical protein